MCPPSRHCDPCCHDLPLLPMQPVLPVTRIMAAIDLLALEARHQVIKRSNWAGENPGVVLVFCIVFIVAVGIIALFIYRKCMARKAAKQSYEVEA
ncbi:hypothetical protein BO85DRAFT_59378 [Aspergillus piperis CBS 112811]|uniref:Uncharacterized protein n=1 Tax=Aspergillus piperis CBS 112811 TaxID=1448313 RepID=A0A8G1QYA2_9EURO|nr:hypothetical protein BO85DRAFT_59378 [Aspergillus piperis CBS 112811]RAH56128.1 hypothetical protein BO85DRAFT_59378 [Aspergillus piperis CBS 112811]